MSVRGLSSEEKRTLALLGVPTGALALAITVVTTYVPVIANDFLTSSVVIGGLIGVEGLIALWLPVFVGRWSDRLGRRLPFLILATPVLSLALLGMAVSRSLLPLAAAVVVFFIAYFVAYEPYRALYPDLVDDRIAGRAQSTQAIWRGAGTGLALVGGGLLIAVGLAVPFVVAAIVLAAAMGAFYAVARRRRDDETGGSGGGEAEDEEDASDTEEGATGAKGVYRLLKDHPPLRAYFGANTCWEASLGALKTFVFLYVIQGLGKSEPVAAGVIGGVALLVLIAAPLTGRLADQYGKGRVLAYALPLYGVGLLVPAFTESILILVPVMIIVGFGGSMVMSQPYAVLQPLMPQGEHGLLSGFYSVSRGIGTALGPALAGLAIDLLDSVAWFADTEGYQAMWLVCGGTILASIPFLRALRRRAGDRIDATDDEG